MSRLQLSTMLLDVFAGILAILMLLVAVLLGILIATNSARGDDDANSYLMVMAGCFALGATGFYALKRWANRLRSS